MEELNIDNMRGTWSFVEGVFYTYISNLIKLSASRYDGGVHEKLVFEMELLFSLMSLASNSRYTEEHAKQEIEDYSKYMNLSEREKEIWLRRWKTFRIMSINNYLPKKVAIKKVRA